MSKKPDRIRAVSPSNSSKLKLPKADVNQRRASMLKAPDTLSNYYNELLNDGKLKYKNIRNIYLESHSIAKPLDK